MFFFFFFSSYAFTFVAPAKIVQTGNAKQSQAGQRNGGLSSISQSRQPELRHASEAPAYGEELESSPVVRVDEHDNVSPSLEQLAESSLSEIAVQPPERNITSLSGKHKPSAGQFYSSATSHGLFTPQHTRQFHKLDSSTGGPQTPTFPAMASERDDVFLGSSPTPGTRKSGTISLVELPTSVATGNDNIHLESDLPSSPPELSPQQKSDNSNEAAESRKSPDHDMGAGDASGGPITGGGLDISNRAGTDDDRREPENSGSTQATKIADSSRLGPRSSDKGSDFWLLRPMAVSPAGDLSKQNIQEVGSPIEQSDAHTPETEVVQSEHEGRTDEATEDPDGHDVESQIASQLQQDMEFARRSQERHRESSDSPEKKKRQERNIHKSARSGPRRSPSPWNRPSHESSIRSTRREERSGDSGEMQHTDSSSDISEIVPEPKLPRGAKRAGDSRESEEAASTDAPPSKKRNGGFDERGNASKAPVDVIMIESLDEHASRHTTFSSAAPRPPVDEKAHSVELCQTDSREGNNQALVEETQDKTSIQEVREIPETQMAGKPDRGDTDMLERDTTVDEAHIIEEAGTAVPDESHGPLSKPMLARATQTTTQSDTTEGGIVDSLRKILDDMKMTSLSRDALRQVDDMLFDIRVEAHEALKRA